MIKIRFYDGGDWAEVDRQQAIEYACRFVFGTATFVNEYLALKYFNKKLIFGTQFKLCELRRYLQRKIDESF